MYLGIDIGTSSVKTVLMDESQTVAAESSRALSVSRPHPQWSEQDPESWVAAAIECVDEIRSERPTALAAVKGVGLSGQMHGATLLDKDDKPLRPSILWNDGRAADECGELETACPQSRQISGNIAMPGFTAPKLLWVRRHEPAVFDATRRVLLPKDYVRLCLSGEAVSEMSDAAGTLWLDTRARRWSQELLAASGLTTDSMPRLVEGSQESARLSTSLARRWGMDSPPLIAGGAGDNAASACGIGAVSDGAAFLSLGTSGVLFVVTERFLPNTDGAVHAFCHAVPGIWHQMGVILSAASCFDWLAGATGSGVADVMQELENSDERAGELFFFPYLSGERTPHNDASLRGAFVGLDHDSTRARLATSVAEGVGFAFRDCKRALEVAGSRFDRLMAVGGGARSRAWLQTLANILGVQIDLPAAGERGAAFGAARLAMIAHTGARPTDVCTPPEIVASFTPESDLSQIYQERWSRYRAMYPALKEALSL